MLDAVISVLAVYRPVMYPVEAVPDGAVFVPHHCIYVQRHAHEDALDDAEF